MQGRALHDEVYRMCGVYECYRSLGIARLLWRTPCSWEHNKQAEVLFASLVAPGRASTFHSGDLTLMTLPDKPPPAETRRFRVLALGTSLRDGLYDLGQLAVREMVPESARGRLSDPLVAAERDDSMAGGPLEQASAVSVRPGTHIVPI